MSKDYKDFSSERKQISRLIFKVLTERMSVKDALAVFPACHDDPTSLAAWHAVVHFEADEDIRRRDLLYKDEQDSYLEMIGFILKDGKELPQNIIDSYNDYYKESLLAKPKGVKGFWATIARFLHI